MFPKKWLVELQEAVFCVIHFLGILKNYVCCLGFLCLSNYPSRPFNLDGNFGCFNRVLMVRVVETVSFLFYSAV